MRITYIVSILFTLILMGCGDNYPFQPAGPQIPGPAGATGATGAIGATGAAGTSCTETVVAGGADITCGTVTVFIANGTTGATGAVGPTGAAGAQGPTGQTGATGAQGPAGQNGTNGFNSLVVLVPNDPNCPTGGSMLLSGLDLNNDGLLATSEVQYSADICNGATGAAGAQGPQGEPGVDLTPTTPIQFCASYGATVYPSNFPEYGLCIDGNIYAVYWDKTNLNAWFSEIVPGEYMSTATGLECDFAVGPNCQVTQ